MIWILHWPFVPGTSRDREQEVVKSENIEIIQFPEPKIVFKTGERDYLRGGN